jgi:hypothetical protein
MVATSKVRYKILIICAILCGSYDTLCNAKQDMHPLYCINHIGKHDLLLIVNLSSLTIIVFIYDTWL